jgi:hypothetical protein
MNWNKLLGALLVLASVAGFFATLFLHVTMTKLEVVLLGAFLVLGIGCFNQALVDDLLDRAGNYLPFLKGFKSGGQ